MWHLKYISKENFLKHVRMTIQQYGDKLTSYDLDFFNRNMIDPVKLIFDKTVYGHSWEEIVKSEIFRQRDKSNTNDIGYFHQRIFQYIAGCTVPSAGWDVIYTPKSGVLLPDNDRVGKVYVEIKNKHNTMNSASASKTYMKMQGQILKDDDCACFLVEVIAKKSQNVAWSISVDTVKQKHKRIRRVSMDEFYALVTGQPDAFFQMCVALPSVIKESISGSDALAIPNDSAFSELSALADKNDGSFALALYMLGFGSYSGFNK